MNKPMTFTRWQTLTALATLLLALAVPAMAARPPLDTRPEAPTAVFAGGCFWGVDAVFRHVKGVIDVESGYAGGSEASAQYAQVSTGTTGHAEAVRVRFNPAQISYTQLLQIFFSVAHDPTQLNRQGPDRGPQYRSAIFYSEDSQRQAAEEQIRKLTASGVFAQPIVTQLTPLKAFYAAEKYHQNYLALHPNEPYIVYHDRPKLEQLRQQFPAWYQPSL